VLGIPGTPVCQTGLVKAMLAPPPLDQSPIAEHEELKTVQLSFQTFSGM
jgi:hypothetical protein